MYPRQDSVFFPRFSIDGSIQHLYSQAQPRLAGQQQMQRVNSNQQNQMSQSNTKEINSGHQALSSNQSNPVNSRKVSSNQINQVNPNQINPNQINPNQINQLNPNQINSNQINQINPNQINPSLGQNQPNSHQLNQINTNQLSQNQLNQLNQLNQINSNQLLHQQAAQMVGRPQNAHGQLPLGSRRSSLKMNVPLVDGGAALGVNLMGAMNTPASVGQPAGGNAAAAAGYMQYPQDFGYMDLQREYSIFYPPSAGGSANPSAVAAAAAAMAGQYNPYLPGYAPDHMYASRRQSEQLDPYGAGGQGAQYQRGPALVRRPSYMPPAEFDRLLRRDAGVGEFLDSMGYQDAADGGRGGAGARAKRDSAGVQADSAPSVRSNSVKTAANRSSNSSSPPENTGDAKMGVKARSPAAVSPRAQQARRGGVYQMPHLRLPQQQFQQFQFAQPQPQPQQFRRPLRAGVAYAGRKWGRQAKEAIKKAAAAQAPAPRKQKSAVSEPATVRKKRRGRKRGSAASAHSAGGTPGTAGPDSVGGAGSAERNVLIPASEAMHTEDGRPLVGATKVDQLMLVIQAREKGITGSIRQAADGTILGEVQGAADGKAVGVGAAGAAGAAGAGADAGAGAGAVAGLGAGSSAGAVSVLPNMAELVGGVEKKRIRGKKKFKCQYCSKKFTQSTHLDVHIRSHIGLKPFPCRTCGKRFTQRGNLRTHMRVHTGEKPYTCATCGKKFARLGGLQSHQLTHTDQKPFKCRFDHCNKSFTQLGNMKAHQNRFHQEAIKRLTDQLARLSGPRDIAMLPKEERELLKYFAGLYKNMNRGIRGRGRGSGAARK